MHIRGSHCHFLTGWPGTREIANLSGGTAYSVKPDDRFAGYFVIQALRGNAPDFTDRYFRSERQSLESL